MTPEEFEELSSEEKTAAIEHNDEHVRQWRGTCQLCRKALTGTRAELREHKCANSPE